SLDREVSQGDGELAVGPHLHQGAQGVDLSPLRVVVHAELRVVPAAGCDAQVAHYRREAPRAAGKGERRDRVERLEDVALAAHNSAAEGRVEVILLGNSPGQQLLGRALARATVK